MGNYKHWFERYAWIAGCGTTGEVQVLCNIEEGVVSTTVFLWFGMLSLVLRPVWVI